MHISDEEQNLMDKYNLGWFYSGGGCRHFSHNLKLTDETLWLINDMYEMPNGELDCSQRFPTDETQLCTFRLYYRDLSDDLGKQITDTIKEIYLKKIQNYKDLNYTLYDGGFYFYDSLKNGVSKMFAITNEIDKLKESQ